MTYQLLDGPSGNAVVVAIDHGISNGSLEGFRNPAQTLEAVLAGNPDAVLVGPHFARRFRDRLDQADVDIVVAGDALGFSTRPGYNDGELIWEAAFDLDFLLELDPVGIKVEMVFGSGDTDTHRRILRTIAGMADELRGTGVPLVVEPVMWGAEIPVRFETDPEYVEKATRIAWEYGADILKLPYTGDTATFEPIVQHAPVPAMILGGPSSGTTKALLADVEAAMDSGARGVMIGRSIWQSPDPTKTIDAMRAIIHDGVSAEDAYTSGE